MKNTILITGASTGIGKQFAFVAAESQNNVLLIARSDNKLKELCQEIKLKYQVEADYIVADLAQPGSAQKLYQEVIGKGYTVNYLINNAGFGDYGNFIERDLDRYRQMIYLNITALTELTYLFVKDMAAMKKGGVLNVASTAAMQPDPYLAVYGATKAYVASFTEALAYELRNTGVTATVLSPGATSTEFFDAATMSKSKLYNSALMPASAVAKIGYDGMMKGKLHVIPGLKNKILAWASAMMPPLKFRLAVAAYVLGKP